MGGKRLDVSTSRINDDAVALRRQAFDNHLDECPDCQPTLCHVAEGLWRAVCLEAVRAHQRDGAR